VNPPTDGVATPVGFRGGLRHGGRALRHRNFRLFFAGQAVSLVGTWMQQVAQAWLVLELTGDPLVLGLVTSVAFLPVLVLGLFGGVIADAVPKLQAIKVTQASQMTLALVLFALVATGTVQVWHVFVLALLLGLTNAVDMPTRQAFTVEMVGREDVGNAIALSASVINAGRIVGPAIAGVTIGLFGGNVAPAFLLNGLSFLGVLLALRAMRPDELDSPPVPVRPRSLREVGTSLTDGIRYVRRTELVLLVVATVGLASTFGINLQVTIPALAREGLGTDATGLGLLLTATGVGSLVASLWIAFGTRPRPAMVPIGALVLAGGLFGAAVAGSYPLALLSMVPLGFGAISLAATGNTTLQLVTPDALRGRVMSFHTTMMVGSTPIGALLMGVVASMWSVEAALAVAGAGCAVTGVVALVAMRRLGDRARIPPAGRAGRGPGDGTVGGAPAMVPGSRDPAADAARLPGGRER
jgi:MFS family permease